MTFSDALQYLKAGRRVTMRRWSGPHVFLFKSTLTSPMKDVKVVPFIAMMTARREIHPWVPTPDLIFAVDYELIDEETGGIDRD